MVVCACLLIAMGRDVTLITRLRTRAQMGKSLIGHSPLFKAVLLECERVLASLPDKPAWSIIEELSKSSEASNIYQSAFSQPLCTALQLGLVVLWKSWGLAPNAVLGHSSGEIAAAYAAGILSLRDAIVVAYYRGLYLGSIATTSSTSESKGGMCAVGLSAENAQALLEKFTGRVQLAAVNSPTSCTLSGDQAAIKEIIDTCREAGTFCRALRVDMGELLPLYCPWAPSLTLLASISLAPDVTDSSSIRESTCEC